MTEPDNSNYKYWVDTLLDEVSEGLSEWERNFVESMKTRLENGWPLSPKQEKKLEQIYERHI